MKNNNLPIILFLLLMFTSGPIFASDRKKVLVVSSYHKGYEWSDGEITGIEKTFYPLRDQVEISVEYMDTKRVKTPEYEKLYLELLKLKYAEYKPDVIIVLDDNAFRFVIKLSEDIFGSEIPIVFAGVNDFSPSIIEGHEHHVTGIVQNMDIKENINLALKIRPDANPLVVVTDESTSGKIFTQHLKTLEGHFKGKRFFYINTSSLNYDEMVKRIEELPSSSVGLLLAYNHNKDRKFIQTQKGYDIITEKAQFPFFGVIDMAVKSGAMGGKVKYGFQHGAEAAEIALQILKGKKPGDFPVKLRSDNTYMFNYNQLNRFQVSRSQLPPNSVIINEPESFYYKYKREIQLIIGTFIFLLASIIVLSTNISRRKIVEKKLLSYQNHLEELVDARTSELKNANRILTDTLEQLTQTQVQLVEAEKLAALGNLVSGVAHQINTPVGIGITAASHLDYEIDRYNRLYRNNKLKKSDMDELLNLVSESSALILGNLKKTGQLIETFKLIAVKNNTNQSALINVKQLLTKLLENSVGELERKKYKIILNCADNINIRTYPSVIAEIFTHLIKNSLKHGFENLNEGTITVDTIVKDNEINFCYQDDGKGINEVDVKHIFEPFYNITGKSGGIGLGLHIVYNLVVHTLKGKISCKSSTAEGCEFSIIIPMNQDYIFTDTNIMKK